ncbi:hypothetical protein OJ252_3526 [Cryptosporidium canis]|uniref:Autophagy-related protein 16 domain-containing protein n=1 Tax=Cryptosporidium canis TaxID=195482 RepID=A0ABQ8P2H1_9CRYT|nr:hypothetical protein OJ252_3526 [Cryptosporidium canis]
MDRVSVTGFFRFNSNSFPVNHVHRRVYLPKDTELKHTFISTQLYNSIAARSADPEQPDGTLDALQQVQFLQGKLSQLQKKLTNSYRNKLNLEDSISQLSEKIEKLERELSEKDKTISRLERTVAHLKSEKA